MMVVCRMVVDWLSEYESVSVASASPVPASVLLNITTAAIPPATRSIVTAPNRMKNGVAPELRRGCGGAG